MDGLAARAILPVSALARVVVPEDILGPNWRFRPFGMRVTCISMPFSPKISTKSTRIPKFRLASRGLPENFVQIFLQPDPKIIPFRIVRISNNDVAADLVIHIA